MNIENSGEEIKSEILMKILVIWKNIPEFTIICVNFPRPITHSLAIRFNPTADFRETAGSGSKKQKRRGCLFLFFSPPLRELFRVIVPGRTELSN
jgi:hypothetical protein